MRMRGNAALLAAVGGLGGLPLAAPAQVNLGFEALTPEGQAVGWQARRSDDRFAVDSTVAWAGQRSLRLEGPGGRELARITQRFPAPPATGNRLRIRARIRTEGPATEAGLWVRIDAVDGLLYVDGGGASPEPLERRDAAGAAPAASGQWALYELQAPVFPDAARITVGASVRGGGVAWFDAFAIDSVSTASRPEAARPAAAYLDAALTIIERHAWRAGTLDWATLRREVRAHARGARQPADSHLALRFALGRLGDRHSYLMPPERVRALEHTAVSNARTGRAATQPRSLSLANGTGYLWLPGFAGGTHVGQVEFAQQVQDLVAGLDATPRCGWVLDLRDNNGGNLWPMLVGIGPLLGGGEAGAVLHRNGRSVPYWYSDGRAGLGEYVQLRVPVAYQLRVPAAPVALLIGEETASSAETLVLAFAGRPNARSFGSPTRGLNTVNRTFPLSDGSALVLAVAASRDPLGRTHAGSIPPDEAIVSRHDGAGLEEQPEVRAALDWLGTQTGSCPAGDARSARAIGPITG